MNLPEDIEMKILSELHLDNIYTKSDIYYKELDKLRKELINLSQVLSLESRIVKEFSDAYFCYNFPLNFMKSMLITKKLFNLYKIAIPEEIKILDIGCGDGAGMFGILYFLHNQKPTCKFQLTGIDINDSFIKRCMPMADWLKQKNFNIDIKLIKESGQKFIQNDKDNYDFIILSNALTEIFKSEKIPLSFITFLWKHLKKAGVIIIIEPALKTLTRRLMKLHNDILVNGIGFILLPCLHNSKCPGLHKKEEWCHQSIKWNPPEYLKMINQKLFRKIEYLKFSYLIISNHKFNSIPSNYYPVISRLSIEKGRIKCFICTEDGIVEVIRLNRERNVINESFDQVCMGDIIEINNPLKSKTTIWKISKDTNVKRLDF